MNEYTTSNDGQSSVLEKGAERCFRAASLSGHLDAASFWTAPSSNLRIGHKGRGARPLILFVSLLCSASPWWISSVSLSHGWWTFLSWSSFAFKRFACYTYLIWTVAYMCRALQARCLLNALKNRGWGPVAKKQKNKKKRKKREDLGSGKKS